MDPNGYDGAGAGAGAGAEYVDAILGDDGMYVHEEGNILFGGASDDADMALRDLGYNVLDAQTFVSHPARPASGAGARALARIRAEDNAAGRRRVTGDQLSERQISPISLGQLNRSFGLDQLPRATQDVRLSRRCIPYGLEGGNEGGEYDRNYRGKGRIIRFFHFLKNVPLIKDISNRDKENYRFQIGVRAWKGSFAGMANVSDLRPYNNGGFLPNEGERTHDGKLRWNFRRKYFYNENDYAAQPESILNVTSRGNIEMSYTGNYQYGANETASAFTFRLQRAFEDLYDNEEYDDGREIDGVRVGHLLNLFLCVSYLGAPSGGSYINDEKVLSYFKRNKGVYIPPPRSDSSCFWDCFAKAMCDCNPYNDGSVTTQAQLSSSMFQSFISWYSTMYSHGVVIVSKEVSLNMVVYIEQLFKIRVTVLDVDGSLLYGTCVDIYSSTFKDDRVLKLCLVESHYVWIKNYVAFVPLNECYRCKEKFGQKQSLQYHLEHGVCLTCDCMKVKCDGKKRKYKTKDTTAEKFSTESEWRMHRDNLESQCPLFSEEARMRRRNDQSEIDQRMKQRFQLPKDRTTVENRDVIVFDLESVVPTNSGDMKRCDMLPHQPYAAGWLSTKEYEMNGEVHIEYGDQCLKRFIDYLDVKYNEECARLYNYFVELYDEDEEKKGKRTWRRVMGQRMKANLSCLFCGAYELSNYERHKSCIKKHVCQSKSRKEIGNPSSKVCPRIVVYAHNGGRYDWLFIHREMIRLGYLDHLKCLRGGGRYINLVYKFLFVFRDTACFLASSLEKLGKDFGVETLKGIFPYDLMQDMSLIHLVVEGEEEIRLMIPSSMLKITDSYGGSGGMNYKRCLTEVEYEEFFNERGWKYDVEAETVKYLRDDVLCLHQVIEKFASGFNGLDFPMDFYDFDTIGQMSHYYFQHNYLDVGDYPSLGIPETSWLRQSVYGGRTEVFIRHLYDNAVPDVDGKQIYYYDVNSLYPYVMEKCSLPGGDPQYFFPEESEEYKSLLYDHTYQPFINVLSKEMEADLIRKMHSCTDEVYGFLEVSIVPPQDLKFPVLPERRCVDGTEKNFFCLRNKSGVYYTEELKLAIRKGYVIKSVRGYAAFERRNCYSKFITDLKRLKLQAEGRNEKGEFDSSITKNKSLRAASKLMQNSSFGKTMQRFHDNKTDIVDNYNSLWKMVHDSEEFSVDPLFRVDDRDVVEVKVKVEEGVNDRSSCGIGAAILAEARMELYSYFEWCEGNDAEVLYCDTDSIVYCGVKPLPAHMLDDVTYGKMKLEIPADEIEIKGFVALSPKCYAFNLKDGTPYIKCKGVSASENILSYLDLQNQLSELQMKEDVSNLTCGEPPIRSVDGLSFDTLLLMVKGELIQCFSEQMIFLKNSSREIMRVQLRKVLSDTFDKRKICLNGQTFAWSNCNQSNFLLDGNITFCSNFLAYGSCEEIAHFITECGGVDSVELSKFRKCFEAWCEQGDAYKVAEVTASIVRKQMLHTQIISL
jgi:hypothetical protein